MTCLLVLLTLAYSFESVAAEKEAPVSCDSTDNEDRHCSQEPSQQQLYIDRIHAWWESMSGQRPVKCADAHWATPLAAGEELNLEKRELVFRTCADDDQKKYLIDLKGTLIYI